MSPYLLLGDARAKIPAAPTGRAGAPTYASAPRLPDSLHEMGVAVADSLARRRTRTVAQESLHGVLDELLDRHLIDGRGPAVLPLDLGKATRKQTRRLRDMFSRVSRCLRGHHPRAQEAAAAYLAASSGLDVVRWTGKAVLAAGVLLEAAGFAEGCVRLDRSTAAPNEWTAVWAATDDEDLTPWWAQTLLLAVLCARWAKGMANHNAMAIRGTSPDAECGDMPREKRSKADGEPFLDPIGAHPPRSSPRDTRTHVRRVLPALPAPHGARVETASPAERG